MSASEGRGPKPKRPRAARAAGAVVACLFAGGCAVGPNFTPPGPPKLDRYSAQPGATRLEGDDAAQTVELGRPTDPVWWRLFGSPALDDLVAAGLKASPTLASARQALQQSQDQARAGAGVFFPSLGGAFAATRERTAPLEIGDKGPGSTFSLYTLSGDINYAVDLFGGERRNVEALNAAADQQRYAVGAAYLLLTGGIVEAAVARAGYADEADTLADIVRLDTDQRDILDAEYKAGAAAWSAVLGAEEQLAADRQSLAAVRQQQAAATTLLNELIGREPAEDAPPPPALGDLTVPADAPVSLPSQLVRQRPDILQAEAALHQASAQVGVATAALFPSISITGDYGQASNALARLGSPAGLFWGVSPTVDVPIFRGGALWSNRRAAQAAYRKAQADYRQTVLAALKQVADQLKALGADAEISAANRSAFDAASLDHALAGANRQAGVIADYDVMTLEIQTDRTRLGLIAAKSQRLQDVVALYLACGGGWSGHAQDSGLAAVAQ
jgi:NodT family efflux transporter outer membrane factor (OMF) lipoprotein